MTSTYHHGVLPLDHRRALATAARRLEDEFCGTFDADTVAPFLHTAYLQLAVTATVGAYLPLLAERAARKRLRAFAALEVPARAGDLPGPSFDDRPRG